MGRRDAAADHYGRPTWLAERMEPDSQLGDGARSDQGQGNDTDGYDHVLFPRGAVMSSPTTDQRASGSAITLQDLDLFAAESIS
jgi:hypothetical protein